jgi:hypothetical protein
MSELKYTYLLNFEFFFMQNSLLKVLKVLFQAFEVFYGETGK